MTEGAADEQGSTDQGWADYYEHTSGREPRPLLGAALSAYGEVAPGATALDIGFGDGTETRALLAAGFEVTAVDADPDAVRRLADLGDDPRLTVVQASMAEADWPPVDLAYAGYALPFCPRDDFDAMWSRLLGALRPGAVLAVDLFGDRDTWAVEDAPRGEMTFVSRARLDDLLSGLDVVTVDEEDEDGMAFSGPKHWHVFHVVARRPA